MTRPIEDRIAEWRLHDASAWEMIDMLVEAEAELRRLRAENEGLKSRLSMSKLDVTKVFPDGDDGGMD